MRGGGLEVDRDGFLLVVLALIFFGFVMVYSATGVDVRGGGGERFVRRQLIWGAVALLGLLGVMSLPRDWLYRLTLPVFVLSLVLLMSVLVLGVRVHGARRWFRLGPVGFQPSELAKVGLLFFLSRLLAGAGERVRSFRVFLLGGAASGLVCALILVEPDFGGAFFLGGWALMFLLMAGVRWWYVLGALVGAVPTGVWLILSSPVRLRRWRVFLDPWSDPRGAGHQVIQSLIALGSGGWRGVGLGLSQQRLSFLPEARTDFIFSIVGEQLGLMGTLALLGLFGLLLFFGARLVLRAGDRFLFLLGLGALSMLMLQVLANVAVATASIPTKGTALPFVSFGGSNLLWAAVSAGLVLAAGGRGSAAAPRRVVPHSRGCSVD